MVLVFFFSSRRRHTRLQGDWSSDVCSSDLEGQAEEAGAAGAASPPRDRHLRAGSRSGGDGVRIASELAARRLPVNGRGVAASAVRPRDRKSTRLNSSHLVISYAVFCLKKKKKSHANAMLC